MAAAEELAAEGIDVTVVDPRTISPLDEATILHEVAATGKALLVQEAPRNAGFVAEIAARIVESDAFHTLKAPIVRLCRAGRADGVRPRAGEGVRPPDP